MPEIKCAAVAVHASTLPPALGQVSQLAKDAARGDKKAIQLAHALLQICEPAIEAQRPVESILITGVLAEGARTV